MKSIISIAFTVILFGNVLSQSIPNPGFESWTNPNGYNIPDGWSTLNDMTAPAGVYTCTKGTPGSPGTSYIKLTSKNVSGLGVVPAVAVSGTINPTTMQPISGFAYNMRPTALAGKWQYMGSGGTDIGIISAVLTKWNSSSNSRDTIGFGSKDLIDMEMAWINFSIPFTYNSNENPDSCIIVLSASGANPAQNSYLYVDNLSFTNPTQSVLDLDSDLAFDLYPNPTSQNISFQLKSNQSSSSSINVIDALGNVCSTSTTQKGSLVSIDVSHLSPGIYFLRMQTARHTTTRKFIKQ